MTIDNFEDHIEPKILDRGLVYFEQDCVMELDQIEAGEFSAEVEGTETYEVYVRFEGRELVESECDCPYDWGDICKHIVAVLYHIREESLLETPTNGLASEDVQEALDTLSEAQLREFVLKYAKLNRSFRKDFLHRFGTNIHEDEEDV